MILVWTLLLQYCESIEECVNFNFGQLHTKNTLVWIFFKCFEERKLRLTYSNLLEKHILSRIITLVETGDIFDGS